MAYGRKETTMTLMDSFTYSDKCSQHSATYAESEATVLGEFSKLVHNSRSPVITIADFGTADGKMVIPTMNKLIEIANADTNVKREIVIYFEDQASNDFNTLCKLVQGDKGRNNGLNVTNKNVYWMVVTESMYNRCFPKNSLDFVISFTAVHWLSKRVTTISSGTDQLHANKHELQLLEEQSANDWVNFLTSRAKELKAGGVIFINCGAQNDRGETSNFGDTKHEILLKALKTLKEEQVITDQEFVDINFDFYCRRRSELERPFHDGTLASTGLKYKSIRLYSANAIYPLDELEKQDSFKKRKHAKSIAEAVQAFTFNAVVFGLSNHRTDSEKIEIAKSYFKKIEDYLFESKTLDVKLVLICAEMVIQKDEHCVNYQ